MAKPCNMDSICSSDPPWCITLFQPLRFGWRKKSHRYHRFEGPKNPRRIVHSKRFRWVSMGTTALIKSTENSKLPKIGEKTAGQVNYLALRMGSQAYPDISCAYKFWGRGCTVVDLGIAPWKFNIYWWFRKRISFQMWYMIMPSCLFWVSKYFVVDFYVRVGNNFHFQPRC